MAAGPRPLDMNGMKPTILGVGRKAWRGTPHSARKAESSLKAQGQAVKEASQEAHRPLLLADAERLEGLDHAGGVPASLQRGPREHRPRRAIHRRVPENLAEQPHAGDRRSRWSGRPSDLGIRV